jgi:curved DNA-binding protein CbpA
VNEIVMVSPMGEARTLAALLGLALAGILEMPREATLLAGVEAPRVTGTRAHGAAAAPPRPLRLVPPPATAAPTGKVPAAPAAPTGKAPTSAAGTTRAPAGPARPGATRPLRIGERRAVTPVRRPPPPAPKPAALPEGQQLEAEMMQRFEQIDALDLYQVLGVSSSAQADDIRRAYYALAQRFHPDRFRNEQSKPRAEKVFGRITEAYATLSNPESRRRYEEEEAGRAPARADSRPADTSDLARQNFRTGREHLDHGHLAEALGFLLNACQQDPTRAEYFELLGITQSRNPRMRKDAEASLLKAIALDPASASAHAHLGALYERTGAVDRAREMYRKALEWDSDNALARQGLERADPGRKGILGLFTRKS